MWADFLCPQVSLTECLPNLQKLSLLEWARLASARRASKERSSDSFRSSASWAVNSAAYFSIALRLFAVSGVSHLGETERTGEKESLPSYAKLATVAHALAWCSGCFESPKKRVIRSQDISMSLVLSKSLSGNVSHFYAEK